MVRLRKAILVTGLLFLSLKVLAPTREVIFILEEKPVEPYKRLIYAIGMVETKLDTLAYNDIEEAVGFFQIRPIRLDDYNKRTGNKYKMKDLYNYDISEKIFLYYATRIGPYDLEKISRNWNGSGHKTWFYWNRVKKYLI
jgi:hypothetical protein